MGGPSRGGAEGPVTPHWMGVHQHTLAGVAADSIRRSLESASRRRHNLPVGGGIGVCWPARPPPGRRGCAVTPTRSTRAVAREPPDALSFALCAEDLTGSHYARGAKASERRDHELHPHSEHAFAFCIVRSSSKRVDGRTSD